MANIDFTTKLDNEHMEITLSQRVYTALRDEIVGGHLKPGTRLTRRGISKKLGVSQNPVTEALMRLEMDGFVENKPLYGCRVRILTIDDIENDQILREAIECQLARLCCQNAEPQEIKILEQKAAELDRITAQGDPQSSLGMKMHLDFHILIGKAGKKCPYLIDELERVWLRSLMRLNWIKSSLFGKLPDNWHTELVKALKGKAPDIAEKAMRSHVKKNEQYDIESLEIIQKEK
ncbi:MAG: GntR family transcriptional regulator [Sedimentisphaeraceae bacterium JB056]